MGREVHYRFWRRNYFEYLRRATNASPAAVTSQDAGSGALELPPE